VHPVERARERYRQRAWAQARECFAQAAGAGPLAAEDLLLASISTYLSGDAPASVEPLEAAYRDFLARGDGAAGIGRAPRPDDRDRRPGVHHSGIAQDEEDVRGHVDRGQSRRVVLVLDGHDLETEFADARERLAGSL
jgi:hypothetical protein